MDSPRNILDLQLTDRNGVSVITVTGPCDAINLSLIDIAVELGVKAGKKVALDIRKLKCSGRVCSGLTGSPRSFMRESGIAIISADEEFACVKKKRFFYPNAIIVKSVDEAIALLNSSD